MKLRKYQQDAITCLNNYLATYPDNPCICLPTGSGKSLVMAGLCEEYLSKWPKTRIGVVAHVQELVRQNAEKLKMYWEDTPPIGIYAAGLHRRDTNNSIIFASIQSVYNKAKEFGFFDLLFVDEAHRIPINGEGMYRTFIKDLMEINPNLRVIGFTATPYRLGTGLVTGPDNILNRIVYDASIKDLIDEEYLCKLTSKGGRKLPDLQNVHIRNGEYIAGELEAAVNEDNVVSSAVDELLEWCSDRKAWLIFCAGVKHAEHVSNLIMQKAGIYVPVVHAKTPKKERTKIINEFSEGKIRAIANVNVLSEGFDVPHVDAIIMLRPTKSAGLYAQQIGRGFRISEGKDDCLVLDFAGNIIEHGPIDSIRIQQQDRFYGQQPIVQDNPVKVCPSCFSHIRINLMVCPDCGYEYPEPEIKHDATASGVPVLSDWKEPEWADIEHITYSKHESRRSGLPSLLVEYHCGIRVIKEWICFEHADYPRAKALLWWVNRTPTDKIYPNPDTIKEALHYIAQGVYEPERIKIDFNGRFPQIIDYDFSRRERIGSNIKAKENIELSLL